MRDEKQLALATTGADFPGGWLSYALDVEGYEVLTLHGRLRDGSGTPDVANLVLEVYPYTGGDEIVTTYHAMPVMREADREDPGSAEVYYSRQYDVRGLAIVSVEAGSNGGTMDGNAELYAYLG